LRVEEVAADISCLQTSGHDVTHLYCPCGECGFPRGKPFSLRTPKILLAELGCGWPLHFDMIEASLLALALMSLLYIPVCVHYSGGHRMAGFHEPERGTASDFWLTAGNMGPDGDSSALVPVLGLGVFVLLRGSLWVYGIRQQQVIRHCDEGTVAANDYCLMLKLPKGVAHTDVDLLQWCNTVQGDGSCIRIVLLFRTREVYDLLLQIEKLSATLEWQGSQDPQTQKPIKLKAQQEKLHDKLQELMQAHRLPVCGFLAEYESCQSAENALPKLRARLGGSSKARWAPAPSDLLWNNLGEPVLSLRLREAATASILVLALLVSFAAILLLKLAFHNDGGFASVLVGILIAIVNAALALLARNIVRLERHPTATEEEAWALWKLCLARVCNSVVLPILFQHLHNRGTAGNWYQADGLANDALSIVTCSALMYPITTLLNPATLWGRLSARLADSGVLSRWTGRLSQTELDERHEWPEADVCSMYTSMLSLLFVCLVFAPIVPLVLPVGVCALAIQIVVHRILLLRMSRRPHSGSALLGSTCLGILTFGLSPLPIVWLWLLSPTLGHTQEGWLVHASWIASALSLVIACISRIAPDKKADKRYVRQSLSYKDAVGFFVSRYHTANPVYALLPESVNPMLPGLEDRTSVGMLGGPAITDLLEELDGTVDGLAHTAARELGFAGGRPPARIAGSARASRQLVEGMRGRVAQELRPLWKFTPESHCPRQRALGAAPAPQKGKISLVVPWENA